MVSHCCDRPSTAGRGEGVRVNEYIHLLDRLMNGNLPTVKCVEPHFLTSSILINRVMIDTWKGIC